jgi:hypothetical protein
VQHYGAGLTPTRRLPPTASVCPEMSQDPRRSDGVAASKSSSRHSPKLAVETNPRFNCFI